MARKEKEVLEIQSSELAEPVNEDDNFEIDIEIIRTNESNPLPEYKTYGAAGMDVYANIEEDIVIGPHDQGIIPVGIQVNIPDGFEIQLRGRSGLAFKNSIIAHVGTIDHGYLDEIQIICWNLGNKPLVVKNGDRVGQIVLQAVPRIKWVEVDNFGDSFNRGGGFGSSGV